MSIERVERALAAVLLSRGIRTRRPLVPPIIDLVRAARGMVDFYEMTAVPRSQVGFPESHLLDALAALDAALDTAIREELPDHD